MCGGPERLKPSSYPSDESKPVNPMDPSSVAAGASESATVDSSELTSTLLELAANDDSEAFSRLVNRVNDDDGGNPPPPIDVVGLWYGRRRLEHRTPLMVAATYGSLSVLRIILSIPSVDVNRSCGPDRWTALHCAASGGSIEAVEAVKLLLLAGADPGLLDSDGCRPGDVITVSPHLPDIKASLEELLNGLRVSTSPPLSASPVSSPKVMPFSEKKEYPIDPSLPDIKNSIYSTDEFRMFSFKIRPCSRAYSHDWTECPFVHPGENARRRDPRKYHYSCVPCPDFRKGGSCRRGDLCEYAHGVFECWLHPAQYRTRLCKDGVSCARRVCFFAHTSEELRPLYVSTGSAVPSPRSSAASMEMMMGLLSGSPSFTPPMSPSAGNGGIGHNWPQPNVPALHLPGSNLQSSRLRASLNARDMPIDDFSMITDFDGDFSPGFASPARRVARAKNLEDLFTAEMSSSPRYADQTAMGGVFSPSHKSAVMNPFAQQQQNMLSPINTNVFSPKPTGGVVVDHPLMLQTPYGLSSSPGRMSPRGAPVVDSPLSSPMGARLAALAQREKLRSLSSRDLGSGASLPIVGSPVNNNSSVTWSKWGSSSGKLDWGINGGEAREDVGQFKRSNSLDFGSNNGASNGGDEPDLSWVHSLVKESPPEIKLAPSNLAVSAPMNGSEGGSNPNGGSSVEGIDHSVLGAWLEQMQLDQLVV
ncbi:Zinc finger CCCH domain-containing protein 24 [Acorus calamus]|uniref:Zinc finger CCCH domain-containing protein 24 n=1 Tax=Acorus calamus TaxID=4465 RepID=A0AAV9BZ68_ACOCL|nr:Zinc finger CCCH domain-containing protein 24 [Acorus calamus]